MQEPERQPISIRPKDRERYINKYKQRVNRSGAKNEDVSKHSNFQGGMGSWKEM